DRADILRLGDDLRVDIGLFDVFDQGGVGQVIGGIDGLQAVALGKTPVGHVGHGGDHFLIELPAQTLLNDLQVEHAQKPAPEAKAQGDGCFRLEYQTGIVELQFLQAVPQVLKIIVFDRIDPGEDHRFDILKTLDAFSTGIRDRGDRIPDLDFLGFLDAGDDIAHVAGRQFLFGYLGEL